jgi:tungstate transport system ATP-binding protein
VNGLYRLSGVQVRYPARPRPALDVESLVIERGVVTAFVGPSGSGKSTLLRVLNFLLAPTRGTVEFAGQVVPERPPVAQLRRVTTVFQRPVLLNRSVRENVAYGLRLRGAAVNGSVDSALERVGLAELGHAAAQRLSGGEMQRVALARALVLEPEVILLDEPTANLDPYNVGVIEALVREQNQQRGTTVVLVTHNVFQARRLAAHTGLLLEGRLVEFAPTDQFFSAPRDPRTAAFVRGDMVY